MSEITSSVDVGGHVLVVGGSAGTLIEPGLADADATGLGGALERPGVGTAAADVVDALSQATSRIEKAKRRFEAVADGSIEISEASDLVDGVIGLLERLDREGHHKEGLKLARALNGLLALAKRWADLVESLRLALNLAKKIGGQAGKAGEAWAQHELGTLHVVAGDSHEADRRLSEARRLRRELGDRRELAATEQNLGALCRRTLREGRDTRRRARRLAAVGAVLLVLVGGAAGVVIASDEDAPNVIGATVRLTVQVTGPGTVESTPAGIRCPGECERDFTPRTKIVLTPDPDDGAEFAGWSGACSDTDPCVLRPRRDRTVVARFREQGSQAPETATLEVDPPADGRVTSKPEGIDCGDDCTEPFQVGQLVTLVAAADPGFLFGAWGGDCPDGGTCSLTMDEDHRVSATFDTAWTISVTVSGVGTVRSDPAGIECTVGTCSHVFRADARQVVLTASEGTFLTWGGDCGRAIETASCTLQLDADHDASANFSAASPSPTPTPSPPP